METNNIKTYAKSYGIPIVRSKTHEYLETIISKTKPKHILEIGTAIGFSGITMLNCCDADLVTIEHDAESIKQAKLNFKKAKQNKRVKLLEGDCLVLLANLVSSNNYDGYFDFIFLDGPKAQYMQMLDLLVILLSPGGTLVADNVLFRGYVNNKESSSRRYKTIIKRMNEFIENCKNNKNFMNFELKNIEDGIIFAQKVNNEK